MQPGDLIAGLSGDLEALRELALRFGEEGREVTDDRVALSHRPHIAPHSYALTLYAPLSDATIARYQRIHGINFSAHYLRILEKLNGAHAFQLSLFGVPPSMADDPPRLNRLTSQPFDVATANQDWKLEYSVPREWFHFGGGPHSFEENIGYFLDSYGTIYACRKNGERLRSWTLFSEFLREELRRAEADYPRYEAFMAELRRASRAPKPWWKFW
jgi:hypothetical protein